MNRTDKWLRRQFLKWNRIAFKGKLPKDTAVQYYKSKEYLGMANEVPKGSGKFLIRVNKKLRWSQTLSTQTLVHEMTHVEIVSNGGKWGHHKRFQKRLLEVYKHLGTVL